MNDYKPSRNREDIDMQEAGPRAARVRYTGDTLFRRQSFYSVARQIQADWNRYIGTLIANGAKSMFKNLINRLQISRTIYELNQLDDRILADIGLKRSDITAVVRRVSRVPAQPVEAQTTITPEGTVTEIPLGFRDGAANTDEQRKAA